jgi:hypothetical protein
MKIAVAFLVMGANALKLTRPANNEYFASGMSEMDVEQMHRQYLAQEQQRDQPFPLETK